VCIDSDEQLHDAPVVAQHDLSTCMCIFRVLRTAAMIHVSLFVSCAQRVDPQAIDAAVVRNSVWILNLQFLELVFRLLVVLCEISKSTLQIQARFFFFLAA